MAKRSAPGKPKKRKASKLAKTAQPRSGSASELVKGLAAQGITEAKIGGFDLDGILRGKYVSLNKLESALSKGFGFCDVIFGWDVEDALYPNAKLTGWHTGYPDAHAVLDPSTLRHIPGEPTSVALLCDFRDETGAPHPACPRSILKRMLKRAEDLGYGVRAGVEFEFFVFRETRETLQEKRFSGLTPLDPGMYGYSWVRSGQDAALIHDLLDQSRAFGIEIEGLHTETGPGVYEAAIAANGALAAADQGALFKTLAKQIAHRHGLSVTFMAKWNAALPGSSGHIHLSLERAGVNAFYDARKAQGMSATMMHFLGGQRQLMPELTALMSPTINSYKRYVPGVWAPLVASWGLENRTCALRVIGAGNAKSLHVEHRQGAADMNPYVAMAAALGAGLWGVERELDPGEPSLGDAGETGPGMLPRTLGAACTLLEESEVARELFGDDFVDHYVMSRRWEVQEYEKAVTDWELKRYFESI